MQGATCARRAEADDLASSLGSFGRLGCFGRRTTKHPRRPKLGTGSAVITRSRLLCNSYADDVSRAVKTLLSKGFRDLSELAPLSTSATLLPTKPADSGATMTEQVVKLHEVCKCIN